MKRVGIGLGAGLLLAAAAAGIYAGAKARAFTRSMERMRAVPVPSIIRSSDPITLSRGKHLAEATAGCAMSDCHGADLGGGKPIAMGPVGTFIGPNLTPAGVLSTYSDGELARLLRSGLRRDGRSVRFMPVQEIAWLPEEDIAALVSYLRTVPAVQRDPGPTRVGLLGKVLDRRGDFVIDVARHIEEHSVPAGRAPEPTAAYGQLLARACQGCHGVGLSGGPIPGAPRSTPVPTNLTPHPSGLAGWSYEDFDRLLTQGLKKDGARLDPFMPIEAFGRLDETEKRGLFAYLTSLPSKPFGGR